MLRLPIVPIPNRFRESILLPWQPPPPPQPVPQPSPWPLVGMFALGLTIGLALGAGGSAELVRVQLRQMTGRMGTSTGSLLSISANVSITANANVSLCGVSITTGGGCS